MDAEIERAVEVLRRGGLIGLPTETVYGLGADAENAAAVRRIFAAKGRPVDHPVIVHLGDSSLVDRYARAVPAVARRLAERFWPGPLTLILSRSARVPDEVTGGADTVGLRVPDHPVALALLSAFGRGVAAPSANRFGRISPTRAEHVREELGDLVEVVLDGGPCLVGVESTIVALSGSRPLLLRPGAIGAAALAEVIGEMPLMPEAVAEVPRAPGSLAAHYAPSTPLELLPFEALSARAAELVARGLRVAVLARHARDHKLPPAAIWRVEPGDAAGFARALYGALRALDAAGVDRILVERVPEDAAWIAVADRLRRAATGAAPDEEP